MWVPRGLLVVTVGVALVATACTSGVSAAALDEALLGLDVPETWELIDNSLQEGSGCLDADCPAAQRRYEAEVDLTTTERDLRETLANAGFAITDSQPCRDGFFVICSATGERDGIRVSIAIQEPATVGLPPGDNLIVTVRAIRS